MELSSEVQKLLERCRILQKQSQEPMRGEKMLQSEDDLINTDEIDFSDDETWLSKPKYNGDKIADLRAWLYETKALTSSDEFHQQQLQMMRDMAKIDCRKSIDSRTFTRPKKRYSRPSIEKYNEDLADINKPDNNNSYSSLLAAKLQEMELEQDDNIESSNTSKSKPLSFDLSQPASASIFDKILDSVPELNSFQNMSPPSLINSMCSSTFTTLMENSYIKNDPVLREIRDADYSGSILLDDSDPPMFQSFSESCSSLNSELTETFIKKASNTTFTNLMQASEEHMTITTGERQNNVETVEDQLSVQSSTNASLSTDTTCKLSSSDLTTDDLCNDEITTPENIDLIRKLENLGIQNVDPYSTITLSTTTHHNGTYKKPSKLSRSSKDIMNFSTDSLDDRLNTTYNKSPETKVTINRSETFKKASRESVENHVNDTIILDDLTYLGCVSPKQNFNGLSNNELNRTMDLKRNSVGYSGGSADSLDAMSSLSNTSSRGSNKMLNMAEVDAIVELQEQSLQVMSTPKPHSSARNICDTLHLSPITSRTGRSDSDLSSSDDYATVRSKLSPATSDSEILGYGDTSNLKTQSAINVTQPKKSVHTMVRESRPLQPARYSRGSYTSLKSVGTTNLQSVNGKLKGSYTNLRSVGSNLRGSYTSLKPVNVNLPVAPPPLNVTKVVASDSDVTRIMETNGKADGTFKVPLSSRNPNQVKTIGDSKVVKPSRGSSLPRPVGSNTGIPRPVSKIPGPRTIRPASSRPVLHPGRQTNEECF